MVISFFFSSRRRHTRYWRDWSSDVCSSDLRGQLSGMTLNTTRSDVVRAVAESVGYAAKHCLTAAGLRGKISICGGGAESRAWRQVLADVLQQPLEVARRPAVGARGAADRKSVV